MVSPALLGIATLVYHHHFVLVKEKVTKFDSSKTRSLNSKNAHGGRHKPPKGGRRPTAAPRAGGTKVRADGSWRARPRREAKGRPKARKLHAEGMKRPLAKRPEGPKGAEGGRGPAVAPKARLPRVSGALGGPRRRVGRNTGTSRREGRATRGRRPPGARPERRLVPDRAGKAAGGKRG